MEDNSAGKCSRVTGSALAVTVISHSFHSNQTHLVLANFSAETATNKRHPTKDDNLSKINTWSKKLWVFMF